MREASLFITWSVASVAFELGKFAAAAAFYAKYLPVCGVVEEEKCRRGVQEGSAE